MGKNKKAFNNYIEAECERQWNENQAKEYGLWEEQADDTKAEYYNDMYKLKMSEINNGFDICIWCEEMFEESDFVESKVCFSCKKAIESRGEKI